MKFMFYTNQKKFDDFEQVQRTHFHHLGRILTLSDFLETPSSSLSASSACMFCLAALVCLSAYVVCLSCLFGYCSVCLSGCVVLFVCLISLFGQSVYMLLSVSSVYLPDLSGLLFGLLLSTRPVSFGLVCLSDLTAWSVC